MQTIATRCMKFFVIAAPLCCSVAFSSEQRQSIQAAEFCARFLDEDSYELVLTQNIEIPKNKNWIIPDSLDGDCSSWEYNYFVDAPQSIEEDDFDRFMRKGGHVCFSTNKNRKKQKIDSLKRKLVQGNSYLGYSLKNAKETLKKYYGKKLKGTWFAELYDSKTKVSSKFTAIITGECLTDFSTTENMIEFCAYIAENPDEYSRHQIVHGNQYDEIIVQSDSLKNNKYSRFEHLFNVPQDFSDSFTGGCVILDGSNIENFNFHLKNAKEKLKGYYGKTLKGKRLFYKEPSAAPVENSFKFTIKGECRDTLTIAEYCFDNQSKRLYKIKDLDYLPKYIFSGETETFCKCKKYNEKLTSFIDLYPKGQIKIDSLLYKECDEYLLYDFAKAPHFPMIIDSTYTLKVRTQAEIQIDSASTKKDFYFYIKLIGNCQ